MNTGTKLGKILHIMSTHMWYDSHIAGVHNSMSPSSQLPYSHVVQLASNMPLCAITRTHFMYIVSLFCASSKQTSSNRRAYLGDYPLQWVQPYSVFIRYCTSLKRKCAALYISTWPYQWGYGHGDPPNSRPKRAGSSTTSQQPLLHDVHGSWRATACSKDCHSPPAPKIQGESLHPTPTIPSAHVSWTSELEFAQGHTFTFRGAQATFMGYMHANSENPT